MLKIVGKGTISHLKFNAEKYWLMLARVHECRKWFKGVPALELILVYIENGGHPENSHLREKFIKDAAKLGWHFPEHLK